MSFPLLCTGFCQESLTQVEDDGTSLTTVGWLGAKTKNTHINILCNQKKVFCKNLDIAMISSKAVGKNKQPMFQISSSSNRLNHMTVYYSIDYET